MQTPKLTFLFLFVVYGPLLCHGGLIRRSRRDVNVSIINPSYTNITNYSYTVSVEWKDVLLGGGVLVADQWVLTAAYNVDGLSASHLKVRVGCTDLSTSEGKVYKVKSVEQHPNYTGSWKNDLSLLKLGSKVNTDYGAPVAPATSAFQGNATGIVTGYGNTTMGTSKNATSLLEMATIELFDNVTCNLDWYGDELSAGQLCGYAPGVGPCYADFGDPLVVCEESVCTLVGMFAGSYGCADDHYPGFYTDIGSFNDWIVNKTTSTK